MITQDIARKESAIARLKAELKDSREDLKEVGVQRDMASPCPRPLSPRAQPPRPLRAPCDAPQRQSVGDRATAPCTLLLLLTPPAVRRPPTRASLRGTR